ncbi:SDR family oxidoreductase [Rhodobacteraceae bacterium B1Z28]|uniref:SDR family oxidoreductase n=1 Tax=Ruegeria haliotis TaxID=2747601 RepID=A0ABX2PVK2_9RHOB|nr:SDR family oxidoreductase [Ruegeria haliotis]NVO57152.1 SDR family oxidoreductase [Ruegeria haliotis]
MPDSELQGKSVLVLGAYGFIGAAVVRALQAEGALVSGLVRNLSTGSRVLPEVTLIQGDLRDFLRAEDWQDILSGMDVVVNCAGALQDGGADDLEAAHHTSIAAMGEACVRNKTAIVQISAIGAEQDANTEFLRTKAAGDASLRACGVALWVLKPGLVIGQSDYGGTALLRMLAAVPVVQPLAFPDTPVQCIGMPDLCRVVTSAVAGRLPQGSYDLVEDTPHPLSDIVAATRSWLGFPPARTTLTIPPVLTRAVANVADQLGRLGWRSPLRSTAMTVMAQGVTGDPGPYRAATGRAVAGLDDIYASLPCAREHRLTARMTLLMPLVVAILSLFWMLSGLFGLIGLTDAAEVLAGVGWSAPMATLSVILWSLIDIALGLAVLWRPWAARVCVAQAGVALFYVLAASLTVPELWLDPLGPLVKVLPAIMLSLVALPMLENR